MDCSFGEDFVLSRESEGGGDQSNVTMTPTIIVKLMRAMTHQILAIRYCGAEQEVLSKKR